MTDAYMDEIIRLLTGIEARLRLMEAKIIQDRIHSALKDDSKVVSEAISNVIMLSIDLYIIFIGYKYLTSSKTELPATAVVGIIGIAFFILNSVFTTSRNIYSSYRAMIRLKKTTRSLIEHIADPLERAERMGRLISTIQTDTSREDLRSIAGDLGSIEDELLETISKCANELTAIESSRNAQLSNNDRHDIQGDNENP